MPRVRIPVNVNTVLIESEQSERSERSAFRMFLPYPLLSPNRRTRADRHGRVGCSRSQGRRSVWFG